MSVAQGSTAFNAQYFTSLQARVSVTVTCDGLQRIATQAVNSVNATISAVTSQLADVQSDYNQLAQRIATLENHIATLAGSQAAFTALTTQAATVSAVVDLGTAITYLKAQATVTATLGTSGAASFLEQALKLAQELIQVQTAYTRLENQITTFTTLLSDLPARLESLQSAITAQASTITNCTIS
jgi:septal ring factor EnvC (AmiA/AmiB activator)